MELRQVGVGFVVSCVVCNLFQSRFFVCVLRIRACNAVACIWFCICFCLWAIASPFGLSVVVNADVEVNANVDVDVDDVLDES